MLTSAVDVPRASADRLLLVLTWELSHLNCLCDPLAWEHCSCVAKLQCEVDWPWLQLTVGCGEAVTVLGDCVVWCSSTILHLDPGSWFCC
jgi:hypothetical protein